MKTYTEECKKQLSKQAEKELALNQRNSSSWHCETKIQKVEIFNIMLLNILLLINRYDKILLINSNIVLWKGIKDDKVYSTRF